MGERGRGGACLKLTCQSDQTQREEDRHRGFGRVGNDNRKLHYQMKEKERNCDWPTKEGRMGEEIE